MNDRTVRRLTALEQSGSTARVLNLASTHRRHPDDRELAAAPFFQHPQLDRCIILKHRLRQNEYEMFTTPRPTATKVMLPIDGKDLKLGARYFFVGQRDFDDVTGEAFGDALRPGKRDRQVLDLIDSLPSLDPFLLREHLKRHGVEPARAYFNISEADVQKMYEFVRKELMSLVTLSFNADYGAAAYASKLVDKLLSNSPDADFEPLRDTLKLKDQEYLDGVFCWRGFLYYKWVLSTLNEQVAKVVVDIDLIQPRGPRDPEAAAYIPAARTRILVAIEHTRVAVAEMLAVYDKAYQAMTGEGQPGAFREFLLAAPDMFTRLGEQLGALQHIVSFWRYRFQGHGGRMVGGSELMDILLDFEDSLAFAPADPGQRAA